MTDTPTTESLLNGSVTVEYVQAERSGAMRLTIKHNEQIVHSSVVDAAIEENQYGKTQRGSFRNDAVEKAENIAGLDADDLETAINEWYTRFLQNAEIARQDMRGEIAGEIINGTKPPIEIHGAPNNGTVYKVTFAFRGRTNTVEFDADVMVPGSGPGALESVLVHQYFEPAEVPKEDWEDIRAYWSDSDNTEVVSVREEDSTDYKADRLVEYLSDNTVPVEELEDLGKSPTNAWVDVGGEETDTDETVVWVQDRHFVDEIEAVANIDNKGAIVDTHRERGEIVEKWRTRRATPGGKRDTLWAFPPDVLGIDVDPYTGDTDEVEP